MHLAYFATLRDVAGYSKQEWNAPVETVGDLLRALCSRYGPNFKRWVLEDDGSLGQLCIILVNGHDIRDLDGMATCLHPDDTICFFPPVAGG